MMPVMIILLEVKMIKIIAQSDKQGDYGRIIWI